MKQLITDYTFDKTAGTVSFDSFDSIELNRILLITNVIDNIIIYNFADPTKGGTVATNELTLVYNTSSMANNDKLQIYYDIAVSDPAYEIIPASVTGPNAPYPFYQDVSKGGGPITTDEFGATVIRGTVLTDEGTNRTNFTGNSIAWSLGTVTFTNGSTTVTGSNFSAVEVHWPQYVKLSTDPESAWTQVNFITDTELELFAPYPGTGGTGTLNVASARPSTGTGASISVANGVCTVNTGISAGSMTSLTVLIGNGSNLFATSLAINQRISNQNIYAGIEEDITGTVRYFSRFNFSGPNDSTVICETGYNPTSVPSVNEIETSIVTLPQGVTTAIAQTYRVEQQFDQVIFYINDRVVATHTKRIPHTAVEGNNTVTAGVRVVNGTTPASSTAIAIDYMYTKVYNRLDANILSPSSLSDGLATNQISLDIGLQLERLIHMLKPLGIVTGAGSNRLSIDVNSGTITTVSTVTGVTTVTTVSTVTDQTNFGGVRAFTQQQAILRDAYANGISSNIIFS